MSAGLVGRDHEYVAVTAPAVIQARADEDAAQAAENAKWLKYGQEWEKRYRQMYPVIEQS